MALDFQVLSHLDLAEVSAFAEARLRDIVPDETERRLQSWSAKWRKEELEHYLRLGWSFIAREDGVIKGFFLGQPLLFFRGQTQTLWVEHIEAETSHAADQLAEVAIRVAREKHLQRVLFADADKLTEQLKRWHPEMLHAKEAIAEVRPLKGN